MKITELDAKLWGAIRYAGMMNNFVPETFVRAGSSLHPDDFSTNSDIDYFLVVDNLYPAFVNGLQDRITPELSVARVGEVLHSFYWKVGLTPIGGHEVNLHIYTTSLFRKYCRERSGPKMYLLNEHRFIGGREEFLPSLAKEYPPSIDTAISDYKALLNKKYLHRFLWAWRSVCLLKEGLWLRNKAEINDWVSKHYPTGSIGDNQKLIIELNHAIINNGGKV